MLILNLPVFFNRYYVLLISFLVGWFFDFFYHTGGIHAASLSLLGYLRYYWLKLIEPSERYEENQIPVVREMGRDWFIKYIAPLVLVHHLFLFMLETFQVRLFFDVLIRSIFSSIISVGLIYFFHLVFFPFKQR
ncbi:MAG: rod shape-determining protein MreD [Bacteroidia bacterium]|nr:rod shape-determining protein MreD [Bacteroidia bacterium]